MYSIKTGSSGQFAVFLGINVSDYVDVMLSEGMALFILNTNEVFSMIGVPCARAAADSDCSFRINRTMLQDLFSSGDLSISLNDSTIEFMFYDSNNAFVWSVECAKQTAFDSVYSGKMKLLEEVSKCKRFDSNELTKIVRIAKAIGGIVNVDSGVASVSHKWTDRVYEPVSIKETMAFTPTAFSILRKCHYKFFSIENYLGAENDGFVVLITKCRTFSNEEFSSICGAKSKFGAKYIANVNFSNLERFLYARKINVDMVTVDIKNRTVCLKYNNSVYRIPITVSDERISDGAEFNEFDMPVRVIMKILIAGGLSIVRLAKKKDFIEVSADGMYVLFG